MKDATSTRLEALGARHGSRRRLAMAAVLAVLAAPADVGSVELHARYTARLSVLPFTFATGTLKAVLPEQGRYTLEFDAKGPSFMMNGKSTGTVQAAVLWPVSASLDSADASEKREIRLALSRGRVRRETVTPPLPYRPDRVPVTPEHRKGVTDPLSALMMPVLSKGGPAEAGNCDRTLPIFEGTERFDIRLSYLRTEIVKSEKGYSGPAVVCRASYKPIAGHRPRGGSRYMENNRTIEAWLVPVGDTKMMAPWRVSMATRIGTMILEASEFSVDPPPAAEQAGAAKPVPTVSPSGTAR